jgi:hypothetical protein
VPPGVINGPSRIYGRIEASIDSLEPAEKDLLGCGGSRFFLKTAGREGRASFLGIIASKVQYSQRRLGWGAHCPQRQGFCPNSTRQCEWIGHKHEWLSSHSALVGCPQSPLSDCTKNDERAPLPCGTFPSQRYSIWGWLSRDSELRITHIDTHSAARLYSVTECCGFWETMDDR